MVSKDTISSLAIFAFNAGLIVGPHLGYVSQLAGIVRSGNTSGYARLVSFILLFSYTLRIFYFFGEPFEKVLLWQAALGVLVHVGMIFTVLRLELHHSLTAATVTVLGDEESGNGGTSLLNVPSDASTLREHSSVACTTKRKEEEVSMIQSSDAIAIGRSNGEAPFSSSSPSTPWKDGREDNRREGNDINHPEGGEGTAVKRLSNLASPFHAAPSSLTGSVEKLARTSEDKEEEEIKKKRTYRKDSPLKKKEMDFHPSLEIGSTKLYSTCVAGMCPLPVEYNCDSSSPRHTSHCFPVEILLGMEAILESKVHGILPSYFMLQYFLSVVGGTIFFSLYYYLMSEVVGWWPGGASVVGYAALGCEATLVLPQILKNARRHSTYGLDRLLIVSWIGGDSIKVVYFVLLHQPLPFLLCGIFQLCLDFIVVLQLLVLPSTTPDGLNEGDLSRSYV